MEVQESRTTFLCEHQLFPDVVGKQKEQVLQRVMMFSLPSLMNLLIAVGVTNGLWLFFFSFVYFLLISYLFHCTFRSSKSTLMILSPAFPIHFIKCLP